MQVTLRAVEVRKTGTIPKDPESDFRKPRSGFDHGPRFEVVKEALLYAQPSAL